MFSRIASLSIVIGALALPALAQQRPMVPFVIPQNVAAESLLAMHGKPIAPDSQRIVSRDGHFYQADGSRFRAWGVNLCFEVPFIEHEEAQALAQRLEAFGINSVRIHHADRFTFPKGIWDETDPTKLSEKSLERLDYLIDQLAQHGIYTNLNLHVSRTHSDILGMPESTSSGNYNKMVDLFTPRLMEAEKQYARQLLGHVNRYRKVSYASDPAIAFVEINNEDSLFLWGWEDKLQKMSAYYADILRVNFNAWLKARYGTTADLAKAWQVGKPVVAAQAELPLPMGKTTTSPQWVLEATGKSKASITPSTESNGMRIQTQTLGEAGWNLQFKCPGLALKENNVYTLRFRARADQPRSISCRITQANAPFKTFGTAQDAKLTEKWKNFAFEYVASENEDNARVSLLFGNSPVAWEVADVVLEARPIRGLREGEDLAAGNIGFATNADTSARRADRLRFLAETEKQYWDGLAGVIRKEMNCKALLTGTMVFGALSLWAQSDMDFVDSHSYWTHPSFPSRPWSPTDWIVEQRSMVNMPNDCKLYDLAACRQAGKPFTVTEYNHAAPNDFQAECIPLITAIAAAQDWDGIWLFSYGQRSKPEVQGFYANYFEIDQNPAKMAFLPAGAVIFRNGGMQPLGASATYAISNTSDPLVGLVQQQDKHGLSMFGSILEPGLSRLTFLTQRMAIGIGGQNVTTAPAGDSQTTLKWIPGRFEASGQQAMVLAETNAAATPSNFQAAGDGPAVLTATALDGQPLKQSKKVLFTMGARCENTDMKFTRDRRSVGKDWGKAPVLVEAIKGQLKWPADAPVSLVALNPDGTAKETRQIAPGDDHTVMLQFSPEQQTMWYILTRP